MANDDVESDTCTEKCFLFERSEFLIDISQKKNPSVCVCSTNLGFSVGYATNLGFSVGYVLCTIYVCTWYQPAEITSCEEHTMVVVYIHEPYPWAHNVVARR